MSTSTPNQPGLRDRKKAATRQTISNVATQLFVERGFEKVSIDDIARAAAVARKTVFNYFPRKEDLVFDREEEVREIVRQALADRGEQAPVDAFQALMRRLLEERHSLFLISERAAQFWRAVAASPALTTRARELQVTLADDLAAMLADAAGRSHADPDASLAAAMLMDTLVVAYRDALRAFHDNREPAPAFMRVLERGFSGVNAALGDTPYSEARGKP
ncbi:TetR/AcrR family transcriptional regulator [Dyella acidiphila]|uniref:TetR family transcriptional regulator n=1 Tax=Dyella acidiphila TaxID=2775866 RepID=A0ABR9G775_9GAMM|nr:TetR/AcrR family transcriptional regulator [Dyella acidiphila]MBE1159867.1 TetR family transcriptional regulator [Dyella acidiphila]